MRTTQQPISILGQSSIVNRQSSIHMIRLLNWILNLILNNPLIFWACMVANLLGVVIGGVWWYGPMLVAAPLWALPFIPDCPEAALLATISFFDLRASRRAGRDLSAGWHWFNALAAFACIKYGLWTLVFWLGYWAQGGLVEPVGMLMFVTHIGLLAEGLLLVPQLGPLSLPLRASVVGWFALSIFVDYGLRAWAIQHYGFPFHPPTPDSMVSLMFWMATLLTVALGAALLLWRAAGSGRPVALGPGRALR
ncbi:MAG: DUF1405 domain-containing protein [Chloroflexaceae bacterium]|nr:DUF1405 domain-containing protein [Chloroflexaceae bacterium]